MTIPSVTPFATFDKASGTQGLSIDQTLWAALAAKHPILDMLQRPSVDEVKFSWETATMPTRVYTGMDVATNLYDSATATALKLNGAGSDIPVGTILRNITRPTPVTGATYLSDELIEVTANDGATNAALTVQRNVGVPTGSTLGTGVAAAVVADTDQWEVVYQPKQEGSSMEQNKYADVAIVDNYVNTVDFYLTITGDQKASRPMVAQDSLASQTSNCLLNLANDIERMFFYGVINADSSTTYYPGADAHIRRTKGLDQWVTASGGNVDYTTLDVTSKAIDDLIYNMHVAKTDMTDRFIIACHPYNARKVSHFGEDKVIVGQELTKWGRYIDTYKSDLGVTVPVIHSLNISKSDLYIVDMNKVALPTFRPFEVAEVTYGDDGTDAWRQRYLTSIGVKCVNGLYSFGKLSGLSWTA
jgi:hypothetical protein